MRRGVQTGSPIGLSWGPRPQSEKKAARVQRRVSQICCVSRRSLASGKGPRVSRKRKEGRRCCTRFYSRPDIEGKKKKSAEGTGQQAVSGTYSQESGDPMTVQVNNREREKGRFRGMRGEKQGTGRRCGGGSGVGLKEVWDSRTRDGST